MVSAVATTALAAATAAITTVPASAATTCTLTPTVREATVVQGVGSYTELARGKETLVRVYLSTPGCEDRDDDIEVTGGQVKVTGGVETQVGPTPAPTSPFPEVAPATAAPAVDAPADLKFVVPGSALTSTATTSFTSTFTISVNFQSRTGKSAPYVPGSVSTTVSRAVGAPSNDARVLMVPMGNAADASTFPSAAHATVQQGVTALSRLLPVRGGIGSLTTPGNGLRYTVLPTMLDLAGLGLMPDGKFCGKGSNWGTVKNQLATFLADWNANNPTASADRVVGLVWRDASHGSDFGCYEGLSTIGAREAFIRVIPDTSSVPSNAGSLIAHELFHTFGGVPADRDDGGYHSPNTEADATAPNRAYNVTTRQLLTSDRTVSRLGTGWNDQTTVFEPIDFAFGLCTLTPNATGCAAPGSVGTAAAGPAFVLAGTTDGTVAGTDLHSFFDAFVERTRPDPTSAYLLAQLGDGGALLRQDRIPVGVEEPEDDANGGPSATSNTGVIDVAVDAHPDAVRFEVRKDGVAAPLYSRDNTAPPVIVSGGVTITASDVVNTTNASGGDSAPALSPDGACLAWVDSLGIRLRATDGGPISAPVQGANPSLRTGELVYELDGDIFSAPVSGCTSGGTPTVDPSTKVYDHLLQEDLQPIDARAQDPSVLPDGRIATIIGGDVWLLTRSNLQPGRQVTCSLSTSESPLLASCSRLSATAEVESAPAGSDAGIAFQRGAAILRVRADGSNRDNPDYLVDGSQPAALGDALAFIRDGSIWYRDAAGLTSRLLTATSDQRPALGGARLAFDRPAGTDRDVFLARLVTGGITVTATDENPQNLRLDIYVQCDGAQAPVVVSLEPFSITGNTATFQTTLPPGAGCAGGTITLGVTDGWHVTFSIAGTVPFDSAPTGAVYSAPNGSVWLEWESIPVAGLLRDAEEGVLPDSQHRWTHNGPGFSNVFLGTGRTLPDLAAPADGWESGQYTLCVSGTDSIGQTGQGCAVYTVLVDEDHDGLPKNVEEGHSCFGTDPDHNPDNAWEDPDADGLSNTEEAEGQPCTSANNATAVLSPGSLNVASSGEPITVQITTSAGDLKKVNLSTVAIIRLGTTELAQPIKAFAWKPQGSTTATIKFDRVAVNTALRQLGAINRIVPFTVTGSSTTFTFRATDPNAPFVFDSAA